MNEAKRTINDHKANDLNNALDILVLDDVGPGGANHHYGIKLQRSETDHVKDPGFNWWEIRFQKGGVKEAGPNGLSGEVLLAICIDRLRGFQAGPFKCKENALALKHLEAALAAEQSRTKARQKAGVEGQAKALPARKTTKAKTKTKARK